MANLTRRGAAAAPLLLVALPTAPARSEAAPERSVTDPTFDAFIQATLTSYAVPGAVVVVADDKGGRLVKGYGVRRLGAPGAMDENTRFQIASVSKFMTATAVAALVDRGVVSWDAPVRSFSPETELSVPYASDNANIRDYFAHRSGMPAYTGDLLTRLGVSTEEIVRRARYLPFDHSFRAKWAYSNYGVFLGQHAAAHAADVSPSALLSNEVFAPLAMTRSGPTRAEMFKDDNHSAAHNIDGSIMPTESVDAFSGAGAVVATGADMARWLAMLLAGGKAGDRQVLTAKAVADMFAPAMVQGGGGPLSDPNDCAGMGCDSFQFLGHRVIEKNGALDGVRTIVTLIPERRLGIFVFANKQVTVFPEAVRAEFLDRVLGPSGVDLQARMRAQQPAWNGLVAIPKPPADGAPLARDIGAFAGAYVSQLYGPMRVTREGAGVAARFGDYPAHLTHWSGDTFLMTFNDPDDTSGLMTFGFSGGVSAATIEGSTVPGAFTISYGHFQRA
jgi:CubicO group peptidase (beta-lactamase class C family)